MADVEAIEAAYARLQAQAEETIASMRTLSTKFQAASTAGDLNAREWNLDLREVAMAVRAEQLQVASLMRGMHDFVVRNAHQPVASAQPSPPPAEVQYEQPAPRGGGLLSRFLHGGLGSSLARGAGLGLGFGVGESIIDDIF